MVINMKLRYAIKRFFSSNNKLVPLILLAVVAAIVSISYAIFTTTAESHGTLNIQTGNLYTKIVSSDLDTDNEVVVAANETKIVDIKVKNINSVNAKYNLYYTADKQNPNIVIGYLGASEVAPVTTGFVVNTNTMKSIKVLIVNNDTDNITFTFGSSVGLENATLAFPSNKQSLSLVSNTNIVKAYTYNEDSTAANYCINGEEATCTETNCIESNDASSCPMGTIIQYKVNDTEQKYFYVLRDEGTKMVLQQRENTVRNIAWVSQADYVAAGGTAEQYGTNGKNDKGPITMLNALETATASWNHVNVLQYEPGTTSLYQNAFTGCTYDGGENGTYLTSCSANSYTMPERTARARMITVLEASSTGCLVYKNGTQYPAIVGNSINAYNYGSCPDWMHNYLYQSTSYGGSYNDNTTNVAGTYDYGYWTLSASSGSSTNAWLVNHSGSLDNGSGASDTSRGARAVVEISK